MIKDLLDGDGVVEVGNDLELPSAPATREGVGMEDFRDEACPTRGTTALLANPGLDRRDAQAGEPRSAQVSLRFRF